MLSNDRRRAATHVLLDDAASLDADRIVLDDDVEHHLRRVLRLRDGEIVSATDGAGRWRMAVVRLAGSLHLESTSEVNVDPPSDEFTLATAIPQGDRADWLVQKATELGATRITLLHTSRSTVRWRPERATRQLARLQRIADEATRQSRRTWRTVVDGPLDATQVLPGAVLAEPGGRPIRADDALIAIGPEGGWTSDELVAAVDTVDLGTAVLRIETAAIAAATLRMVAGH